MNIVPETTDNVLNITKDMLVAAKTGDWEQLNLLEGLRSEIITKLFSDIEAVENSGSSLVPIIEAVIEIDRQIITLCTDESISCKKQIRTFNKGRKAVASYHQFLG